MTKNFRELKSRNSEILGLLRGGGKLSIIADQYGISINQIRNICKKQAFIERCKDYIDSLGMDDTSLELACLPLSFRAYSVLMHYFGKDLMRAQGSEVSRSELVGIDATKLSRQENCGKLTLKEIMTVVEHLRGSK